MRWSRPSTRLFEAHLDRRQSRRVHCLLSRPPRPRVGARVAGAQAAFFWIGSRGNTMLGLWGAGAGPQKTRRTSPSPQHSMTWSRRRGQLQSAGITRARLRRGADRRTRRPRLDAGGVGLLPRSRRSPAGVHRDARRRPASRRRRPDVARVDARSNPQGAIAESRHRRVVISQCATQMWFVFSRSPEAFAARRRTARSSTPRFVWRQSASRSPSTGSSLTFHRSIRIWIPTTPPAAVIGFRAALEACDAILISSPEYAHGVSGVLKNALDWVVGSGELIDKPIALINASARATHAHASSAGDPHDDVGARDWRRLDDGSARRNRVDAEQHCTGRALVGIAEDSARALARYRHARSVATDHCPRAEYFSDPRVFQTFKENVMSRLKLLCATVACVAVAAGGTGSTRAATGARSW